MVKKAGEIAAYLDKKIPPELAMEWDNVGLCIGDPQQEVEKILLALDIDEEVALEAAQLGAQMVITHHPLIFEPMKKVTSATAQGRAVMALVSNGICAYNAHTNLDSVDGGLNDFLAEKYKLCNVERMECDTMFRKGQLPQPMKLTELADFVAKALECDTVTYVGDPDRMIHSVGICSGGGGSSLCREMAREVDAFLTGDIKYSNARNSVGWGLALVQVDHYDSEKWCVDIFKKLLQDAFPQLELCTSRRNVKLFHPVKG